MGWTTAPLAVKLVTIAVFVGIATVFGVGAYSPAHPQWPLLIFASVGMAALAAWCVLKVGNLVTHPRTRAEARFIFSRQPYAGSNRIVLLQLVITVAIGVMALVNLFAWARHGGGWLDHAIA